VLSHIFFLWEQSLSRRDTNRQVRPFEWGPEFISGHDSAMDPKAFLLNYSRQAIRESDPYHSYEPVRDWRLDGRHLTFTSPISTIIPETIPYTARISRQLRKDVSSSCFRNGIATLAATLHRAAW
jgi:hypothetical protein